MFIPAASHQYVFLYPSCQNLGDKVLHYVQPQLITSSASDWVRWINALSISIATQVIKPPQTQTLMLSAHWSLRNGLVCTISSIGVITSGWVYSSATLCAFIIRTATVIWLSSRAAHMIAALDGHNELNSSYKCQLFPFGIGQIALWFNKEFYIYYDHVCRYNRISLIRCLLPWGKELF